MKTYKDLLKEKGFTWDEKQEFWKKNLGFGRSITVDVMFRNLFVIESGGKKIHDNYIGTYKEFETIINKL